MRFSILTKAISILVIAAFIFSGIIPPPRAYAQVMDLPVPGTMVSLSPEFAPAVVKGIKVDPNNPLFFNFLIDPGQVHLSEAQQKIQYHKLITFFLAALTTPEKDMWVNLSPYEHQRIIGQNFGTTEMGRDLLAQDYILKQLTASLVYPEEGLGKKFWDTVYERVREETGSTAIPVNTFNKVWIVPDTATVFERGNVAMVVESHLKVLMEEDYLSLDRHANAYKMGLGNPDDLLKNNAHRLSSQVMRQIIIPAIEKEVNEGQHFAQLRQMYNSMILATWFKKRLRLHLLSKIYVNQNKDIGNVQIKDPKDNERIYQRYVKAYKKGVFNYIKEEADETSGEVVPRKYFSGGATFGGLPDLERETSRITAAMMGNKFLKLTVLSVGLTAILTVNAFASGGGPGTMQKNLVNNQPGASTKRFVSALPVKHGAELLQEWGKPSHGYTEPGVPTIFHWKGQLQNGQPIAAVVNPPNQQRITPSTPQPQNSQQTGVTKPIVPSPTVTAITQTPAVTPTSSLAADYQNPTAPDEVLAGSVLKIFNQNGVFERQIQGVTGVLPDQDHRGYLKVYYLDDRGVSITEGISTGRWGKQVKVSLPSQYQETEFLKKWKEKLTPVLPAVKAPQTAKAAGSTPPPANIPSPLIVQTGNVVHYSNGTNDIILKINGMNLSFTSADTQHQEVNVFVKSTDPNAMTIVPGEIVGNNQIVPDHNVTFTLNYVDTHGFTNIVDVQNVSNRLVSTNIFANIHIPAAPSTVNISGSTPLPNAPVQNAIGWSNAINAPIAGPATSLANMPTTQHIVATKVIANAGLEKQMQASTVTNMLALENPPPAPAASNLGNVAHANVNTTGTNHLGAVLPPQAFVSTNTVVQFDSTRDPSGMQTLIDGFNEFIKDGYVIQTNLDAMVSYRDQIRHEKQVQEQGVKDPQQMQLIDNQIVANHSDQIINLFQVLASSALTNSILNPYHLSHTNITTASASPLPPPTATPTTSHNVTRTANNYSTNFTVPAPTMGQTITPLPVHSSVTVNTNHLAQPNLGYFALQGEDPNSWHAASTEAFNEGVLQGKVPLTNYVLYATAQASIWLQEGIQKAYLTHLNDFRQGADKWSAGYITNYVNNWSFSGVPEDPNAWSLWAAYHQPLNQIVSQIAFAKPGQYTQEYTNNIIPPDIHQIDTQANSYIRVNGTNVSVQIPHEVMRPSSTVASHPAVTNAPAASNLLSVARAIVDTNIITSTLTPTNTGASSPVTTFTLMTTPEVAKAVQQAQARSLPPTNVITGSTNNIAAPNAGTTNLNAGITNSEQILASHQRVTNAPAASNLNSVAHANVNTNINSTTAASIPTNATVKAGSPHPIPGTNNVAAIVTNVPAANGTNVAVYPVLPQIYTDKPLYVRVNTNAPAPVQKVLRDLNTFMGSTNIPVPVAYGQYPQLAEKAEAGDAHALASLQSLYQTLLDSRMFNNTNIDYLASGLKFMIGQVLTDKNSVTNMPVEQYSNIVWGIINVRAEEADKVAHPSGDLILDRQSIEYSQAYSDLQREVGQFDQYAKDHPRQSEEDQYAAYNQSYSEWTLRGGQIPTFPTFPSATNTTETASATNVAPAVATNIPPHATAIAVNTNATPQISTNGTTSISKSVEPTTPSDNSGPIINTNGINQSGLVKTNLPASSTNGLAFVPPNSGINTNIDTSPFQLTQNDARWLHNEMKGLADLRLQPSAAFNGIVHRYRYDRDANGLSYVALRDKYVPLLAQETMNIMAHDNAESNMKIEPSVKTIPGMNTVPDMNSNIPAFNTTISNSLTMGKPLTPAMKTQSPAMLRRGGIDFDSKYLQMNLQGDAAQMTVPKGFEWLLTTPIRGFNAKILDLHSGTGFELSFFKGLLTTQEKRRAQGALPKPSKSLQQQLAAKEQAKEEEV